MCSLSDRSLQLRLWMLWRSSEVQTLVPWTLWGTALFHYAVELWASCQDHVWEWPDVTAWVLQALRMWSWWQGCLSRGSMCSLFLFRNCVFVNIELPSLLLLLISLLMCVPMGKQLLLVFLIWMPFDFSVGLYCYEVCKNRASNRSYFIWSVSHVITESFYLQKYFFLLCLIPVPYQMYHFPLSLVTGDMGNASWWWRVFQDRRLQVGVTLYRFTSEGEWQPFDVLRTYSW